MSILAEQSRHELSLDVDLKVSQFQYGIKGTEFEMSTKKATHPAKVAALFSSNNLIT